MNTMISEPIIEKPATKRTYTKKQPVKKPVVKTLPTFNPSAQSTAIPAKHPQQIILNNGKRKESLRLIPVSRHSSIGINMTQGTKRTISLQSKSIRHLLFVDVCVCSLAG